MLCRRQKEAEEGAEEWTTQRKIEEDRRAKDHADWDAEAKRLKAAKAAEAAEATEAAASAKAAAKPKRMTLEERMIKEREDKRASQALRCPSRC